MFSAFPQKNDSIKLQLTENVMLTSQLTSVNYFKKKIVERKKKRKKKSAARKFRAFGVRMSWASEFSG